jgi:hypothetical protein
MTRLLRYSVTVLCAGLLSTLSAAAQSAPPADHPPDAATTPAGPPPRPKNLKVLPKDITNADLRRIMHEYADDLGVKCEFCHAPEDPVTHHSDRASDENPKKDVARFMMQMTAGINDKLETIPGTKDADPISCSTCHRGEKHPPAFVPPPHPEGNRPPGAPPEVTPPATRPPAA